MALVTLGLDNNIERHGQMTTEADLRCLEQARTPFWTFDIDQACVLWANSAAIELWDATTLSELQQREMRTGMSGAVQSRLKQYQHEFESGRCFDETWTLYPKGKPTTTLCRFRGLQLEDGRVAMLCEGQVIDDQSPEILRGGQALLYTGAMVSTYDQEGRTIYANPAALRGFRSDRLDLASRFVVPEDVEKILNLPANKADLRMVARVKSASGIRIHEVEVTRSYDALSGEPAFLLTEIDISEKERAKRTAERLANIDGLTRLYNRNYLSGFADDFITHSQERGRNVTLGLFDLDRFKVINDTHGHDIGDALLKSVAADLRKVFGGRAILGRLGGDEFCFLISAHRNHKTASVKARKFLSLMRKPKKLEGREIRSGVSIGMITVAPGEKAQRFDNLLRNADLALYEAKALGGNAIRYFRPALARKRHRFLSVEAELGQALKAEDDRFRLVYQPKVDLRNGRVTGAESLARFTCSKGEGISPGEFIPIAESTGLIHQLGSRVIAETAEQLMALRREFNWIDLSVNVSPLQFQGSRLLSQLRSLAGRSGFDPTGLQLELTESALHLADADLHKKLNELVDLGYPIAIDDFGAAYSNIARLSAYPVTCLKFDRSLIAAKNNTALSKVVINIGAALNLKVVAEGVETVDQRDWLMRNNCFEHQGFLYARPKPIEEVIDQIAAPWDIPGLRPSD